MKTLLRVRSWGPILALPPLIALQALAPTGIVMMVLVILVGLLTASLLWVLQLRKVVRCERQSGRDWAHLGETLDQEFSLNNDSWLPVPWAEVSTPLQSRAGAPSGRGRSAADGPGADEPTIGCCRALSVPARGAARWKTQIPCTRRGVYTLGPTRIRSGDPFGLFEVILIAQDVQTFYVYPAVSTMPLLEEPTARLAGAMRASERLPRRSLAHATDVAGIRSYVPGDPFSHIHWRSTAHHSATGRDEIMVKEFEPESLADFWIVLDLDANVHWGEKEASTEEYAVKLAASLAYQVLRRQRAVGLLAHGAQPFVLNPYSHPEQLDQLLRILAGVHADGSTSLAEVLGLQARLIRSGAQCALLTPSCDPLWIESVPQLLSRSIQVSAFLLDGRPFGGREDMRPIVERLAILGVNGRIIGQDVYARLNPQPPKKARAPRIDTRGAPQSVAPTPVAPQVGSAAVRGRAS
ncbi:MAG: DUF58 domain-containing protein [Chloroflexi bacterium]|nr:DUF58 domain-containing protein [Chloroflexota bacterium]